MIREQIEANGEKATLLHMFLDQFELDALQELAASRDFDWEPGRSPGRYFKLDITELVAQGRDDDDLEWLSLIGEAAEEELAMVGGPAVKSDAYLIYYPPGGYVKAHLDPAPKGMELLRLNVVVRTDPTKGGLIVGHLGKSSHTTGSGIIFSASKLEHRVESGMGDRLVLSFGALVNS